MKQMYIKMKKILKKINKVMTELGKGAGYAINRG